MRALALALLLLSCEANAPNAWQQTDAPDVTDPYGDSEPNCPTMTARQKTYWLCNGKGKVALYGSCVTAGQATAACAALGAAFCHDGESGLCAACGM